MNIKPFALKEKATGIIKEVFLPYGVQLHRSEFQNEYIIINAFKLLATEEPQGYKMSGKDFTQEINDFLAKIESMGKQLRPEMSIYNHNNEPAEGYKYYSWKDPKPCSECGEIIQEYQYYYHEKRQLTKEKTIVQNYFCCMNCYQRLAPKNGL